MKNRENIRFHLRRISTDQFAIIEEAIDKESQIEVVCNLQFFFFENEKQIKISVNYFFQQGETVLIKLAVSCIFDIFSEDWELIRANDNSGYLLARNPAIHLATVLVGLSRGVLHVKLDGTSYASIILPPINIQEIIPSDVSVKSNVTSEKPI